MSVSQFPDDEVIKINDNVFIHKPKWKGSQYKVWLVVGVQYFDVGMPYGNKKHACWHASMLVKAIDKLRK